MPEPAVKFRTGNRFLAARLLPVVVEVGAT